MEQSSIKLCQYIPHFVQTHSKSSSQIVRERSTERLRMAAKFIHWRKSHIVSQLLSNWDDAQLIKRRFYMIVVFKTVYFRQAVIKSISVINFFFLSCCFFLLLSCSSIKSGLKLRNNKCNFVLNNVFHYVSDRIHFAKKSNEIGIYVRKMVFIGRVGGRYHFNVFNFFFLALNAMMQWNFHSIRLGLSKTLIRIYVE